MEKKCTRMQLIRLVTLVMIISVAICSCKEKPKYAGPLSPEESMKTFQFSDDFKAELFASEPLVQDPVSVVFDDNGDAYVVEMADANMPDSIKGRGKIVLLRDLDGDGKADTSILFAEGLKEATTVLPWQGGLLVTAAPNILYMKDIDGDHKADQIDTIFTGFFVGNDEAQITSLKYGIDNWIYADNTGQKGEVTSPLKPGAPVLQMQGADFRFRLDNGKVLYERTTAPGQYGLALDDWGHRFFTQNTIHIRQAVMPIRYMERHPFLPLFGPFENISDHELRMYQLTPTPWWRQQRTDRRNQASTEAGREPTEKARDYFTGASGGSFYGGDKFPDEYYGSIFTGEVAGNLIHRDVLANNDDTNKPFYVAKRGSREQDKEFMASTDSWFRPTNFTVAPDGYLYVVDMYRQHIETPVSIPEDLQEDMDFMAGSDMGRIYRIVPKNAGKYDHKVQNVNDLSSGELVVLLSNPNRWYRDNARRILIDRQDKSVVPDLEALFNENQDSRIRIQALYALEGLNALNKDIVSKALQDSEAGIREHGVILSERFPALFSELKTMINDNDPRVAMQAVFSLGQSNGQDLKPVFSEVIEKRGASPWFRIAVLSSKQGASVGMLAYLMKDDHFIKGNEEWKTAFLKDLSYSIGLQNDKRGNSALGQQIQSIDQKGMKNLVQAMHNGFEEGIKKAIPEDQRQNINIQSELYPDRNTKK